MRFVKSLIIVFLFCLVIVTAANTTETPRKQDIKMISLCDGCVIGDSCVQEGVQKKKSIGGPSYYCGPDGEIGVVKDIGEACMMDYECAFYYCHDGLCDAKVEEGNLKGILLAVFIAIVIIFAIVIFFIFRVGGAFSKISKDEEKMEKENKKRRLFWRENIWDTKPRNRL